MAASKTILNVSGHGKSVDIHFVKLEHDYDKQLMVVDQPITSGSGGVHNDSATILLDIGRLKQVISITNGWLTDESTKSMYSKKRDLEYMMRRKGNLTIKWKIDDAGTERTVDGSEDSVASTSGYQCNIVKCKISEVPGRVGESTQALDGTQTKSLMISIQFAIGQHRG